MTRCMVDYFSLAITHGLLALAAWRLMLRADLDRDPPVASDDDAGASDQAASIKPVRRA